MNPEEVLETAMGALASVEDAASMIGLRLEQPDLERQRRYLMEELADLMAAHREARRSLVALLGKRASISRRSRGPEGEQLSLFEAQDIF